MISLPALLQATLDSRSAFNIVLDVLATRGDDAAALFPSSGRLTWDRRRTIFGDGELVVPVDTLPARPSDLLTPFGTTITVQAGIEIPDGTSATVPAGVFKIDASFAAATEGGRLVTIPLLDLAQVIAGYRFEEAFPVPGGDLAATIDAVVTDRTGTSPALPNTGVTIGARTFGLDTETDPWREIAALASNFGFRLYYDRDGTLQLSVVDPPGTPRAVAPVSISSSFDRRPANVVVARGEPADGSTPVVAIVVDDDPDSPTYAGTGPGQTPYGRITRFFASPLLTTVGAATLAAQTILNKELAEAASWTVTRAFDPTVEPDDVLAVTDEAGGLVLQVDAVTVGIGEPTTIEARELP